MSSDAVSRVRYFPGQFLRTPDFTDEQRYHLDMRRRHNIGQHTFGIVTGLEIAEQDGRLVVRPGLAVDGYGRELVLTEVTPLDAAQAFTVRGTDRLDVWIAYQLVASDPAPPGFASCTDDNTSYRVLERPVLRFTTADPGGVDADRRRPATVPEGDRDFGPARTPPDDPVADWPVFLGTLTRVADGTVAIGTDDRPYAGLVGAHIRAPSERASVQLGATNAKDPFEFAVRIAGVAAPDVPRLAVLRDGALVVAGDTTVIGDVEVGGVLRIDAEEVADLAAAAPPGTLSRLVDATGAGELRLQVDGPLGSTTEEVVIGTWTTVTAADGSTQQQFRPCLTVRADQSVTVHGNLLVEGDLQENVRREPQLSADAETIVNAAFLSGVGGASAVIDTFYESPFDEGTVVIEREAAGPDPVELVVGLAGQQRLGEFAAGLRARDAAAADQLRTALDPGS